jgi:preprotein translocase subunit SecF
LRPAAASSFAFTGSEFNLTSIASILTIMGFSINHKIVAPPRPRAPVSF